MVEKKVRIPNMMCNHCVMHIKEESGKISGVDLKETDFQSKEVVFSLENPDDWNKVSKNLEEIGYPAEEI